MTTHRERTQQLCHLACKVAMELYEDSGHPLEPLQAGLFYEVLALMARGRLAPVPLVQSQALLGPYLAQQVLFEVRLVGLLALLPANHESALLLYPYYTPCH